MVNYQLLIINGELLMERWEGEADLTNNEQLKRIEDYINTNNK
jgi:hypothetical protein